METVVCFSKLHTLYKFVQFTAFGIGFKKSHTFFVFVQNSGFTTFIIIHQQKYT